MTMAGHADGITQQIPEGSLMVHALLSWKRKAQCAAALGQVKEAKPPHVAGCLHSPAVDAEMPAICRRQSFQ